MRYLLDTNTCAAIIRKQSPIALTRLTQHAIPEVGVSALTVAELQFGVARSAYPAQNQQALDYFLLPLIIAPFDADAAHTYGAIRQYLESRGMPTGAIDTLLAAQAISHALILVTNNRREFERVPGLTIEDWTLL